MSNFTRFWKGNKKSTINVTALLFLVLLTVPRLFEDIQVMIMYASGKPWYDLVCSVGLSCNIGLWDIAVFGIDVFVIIFVVRIMTLPRDPRIATEDPPK